MRFADIIKSINIKIYNKIESYNIVKYIVKSTAMRSKAKKALKCGVKLYETDKLSSDMFL